MCKLDCWWSRQHSKVTQHGIISSSDGFLCKRYQLRAGALYLRPYLDVVTSPSTGCLSLAGLGGHWNLLTICLLKYTTWIWLDVRGVSGWADFTFTVTLNHLANTSSKATVVLQCAQKIKQSILWKDCVIHFKYIFKLY